MAALTDTHTTFAAARNAASTGRVRVQVSAPATVMNECSLAVRWLR
jgi:hypothetical protein